jgi:hypothetical protein
MSVLLLMTAGIAERLSPETSQSKCRPTFEITTKTKEHDDGTATKRGD